MLYSPRGNIDTRAPSCEQIDGGPLWGASAAHRPNSRRLLVERDRNLASSSPSVIVARLREVNAIRARRRRVTV